MRARGARRFEKVALIFFSGFIVGQAVLARKIERELAREEEQLRARAASMLSTMGAGFKR